MPGDPTDVYLSPTIPSEVRESLRTQFGLDRSLGDQYVLWMQSILVGDFGVSLSRNAPVIDVLAEVFPNTLILASAALSIEVVLGILLALLIFMFEGKRRDTLLSNALLVVYTIPSFWIGMMLLVVFAYGLGMFPSSHMYTSEEFGSLPDKLHHLVLPALAVSIPAAAGFARYLRSSMQNILKHDYVLSARAMGLSPHRVFFYYVLPNAATPMIALLGVEIGTLLSGVLVTEVLFSWPGMGQVTVHAIFSRDYPLVLGCTIVAGIVVILGSLIADLLNAILNPKIRLSA